MNAQKVMRRLYAALSQAGRDRARAKRAVDETRAWLLAQAGREDWSPELRLHLDDEFKGLMLMLESRAAEIEEYEWAGAAHQTLKEYEEHGT
jgi:hypothetical protein